jgi:nicotinamidase-related amidase
VALGGSLDAMTTALVVIDVQRGFDDPYWGPRNNPDAEENIAALLDGWRATGRPVVLVHHDSLTPGSPLAAGTPGNGFAAILDGVEAALTFGKNVNSAFHGEIDLDAWLREHDIEAVVLVGIQTNMCVETTARVGGNLGHRVTVAIDATFTFDLAGPDGAVLTAEELTRATAVNLHGGGFARIATTTEVLAELGQASASRANPA